MIILGIANFLVRCGMVENPGHPETGVLSKPRFFP